jgi:hypothetical protein
VGTARCAFAHPHMRVFESSVRTWVGIVFLHLV